MAKLEFSFLYIFLKVPQNQSHFNIWVILFKPFGHALLCFSSPWVGHSSKKNNSDARNLIHV